MRTVKISRLVTVLLLLSVITMTDAATTSGHIMPQASPTFFPSLTFQPSFTFVFPTVTTSTHMFTFLPSFTFVFPTTTTGSMASSTVVQQTDWAVLGAEALPLNPQAGEQMFFSMSLAALSSNVPFPQHVYVQCQIDGFSCGAGTIPYNGPIGSARTVSANSYWPASPGAHVLTWYVDTSLDPNPGNNALSIQFYVQPPPQPTTVMPSIQTTTQEVTTSPTQPLPTIVQTSIQTVTQSPTESSSAAPAFSLQDYSLPLIGIIVILLVVLAYAMGKRKTSPPVGPQSNAWFCTHCGTPNSINDNFCAKCGTARPKQ